MNSAKNLLHNAPKTSEPALRNLVGEYPMYKALTVTPGKDNNKLFMVIPGASHTDLYDQKDIIPFDQMVKFFNEYLK